MQHPAPTVTATVAAYLRVSSQAQRQSETIASQREAVLDHGRSLGWAIPDDLVFADDGFSGATLERPALDALRDGVARGEIETVLVLSIDRMSRNFAHQILLQEEFARSGATVRCVQEPDDATPQGMLLRQILSVISEYERTQIAERSRRGKIHRARQGSLNMLTRAPYGYRLIRKTETCGARFEIDEAEARVVRRIFDLYVRDGLKMHQIAPRLDEEGLHPRHSRHWPISTVAVILRNEAYIGKAAYMKTMGSGQRVRHNRTGRQKGGAVRRLTGRVARPREDWIELAVPAIVDPALFARAQDQRAANRRFSGRKTVEPTLLQGLCVCLHCGYAMGRNSGTGSRRTPRVHYCRCHGSEGWRHPEGAVCDNPAVRADELDAAVWTEVLALLENPDLVQGEITRRLEAANDTKDVRQRTDSLQGELARITTRMRRLLDAYQDEVMTLEELRERKIPLQARQRAIQSELRALKAAELDRGARLSLAETTERFLGRLRTGAKSVSLAERQRIVRLLVREVRVGKDKVTICHSVPVPTSPPRGSGPSGNDAGKGQLLDSRCPDVVENQRVPALQVPVREAPLDPGLALQQPVEHVQHLVAGDGPEPEQGPEARRGGLRVQRPGRRQLGGGVDDAGDDGRHGEIPHAIRLPAQDADQAERPERSQHRRHMAVGT
ncbi:MAG: recombinase family protein [Boseongicola sp.]|nr:recombinase family protein [Boseongicola sp.]